MTNDITWMIPIQSSPFGVFRAGFLFYDSDVIGDPFYVCGPTASGKTGFSLALAEAIDGEIVNGDAFQLYRGLEVLTAAPNKEEKARCPHHLFGVIDPDEAMDAARYAALAGKVIQDIRGRGKCPIVVGGSGLYLKFLTHGIADAPPANEKIRAELETLTVDEIYRRLKERDPEEAARQNRQNRRHLSRALEICLITGEKASERRRNFSDKRQLEGLAGVVLSWSREVLAERIAKRTRIMLESGAIDEVRGLPLDARTIRQAIGVREIECYLDGEMTRDECEERIIISTRQYAKRQRNWYRREGWLQVLEGSLPVTDQVARVIQLGWVRCGRS